MWNGTMDEKTEHLREVFMDVTEESTVTESQTDDRGSLAGADEATVTDRLIEIIEKLRDHHEFETDLSTDRLQQIVRGFYDGADDETIAETIDADRSTVFKARLDLHLLRDRDTDAPVDPSALRAAQDRRRRVSQRFQVAFEDAIPDTALSTQRTESATEDGLADAAEDIETDTKF